MANDTPPPAFYNCCKAEIECDENGEECAVTVSCQLRDSDTGKVFHLEKTVHLQPLIDFLDRKFRAYHASLHASETHAGERIEGLGSLLSKAKNAAKRIASSKAAKDLWLKVKPLTKKFIENSIPGGAATFALAERTYDTVNKARKGDPKALAEIKSISQKALAGNPLAKEIMRTAKVLNNAQKLKDGLPLTQGKSLAARASSAASPFVRPSRDTKEYEKNVTKDELVDIDYQDEADSARAIREMAEGGADITDIVEGWKEWMYSKQYRSPMKAILDSSPGVGMAARSLYTDGVNTLRARALVR